MLNNNSILNVNNGGSIILDGGGGYEAIVSHTTGYYEFNVNAGGTISADSATFEYMGTPYGINIKVGATVYPDNCFNFCEFKNGNPSVTNGALLTINNGQDLTIEGSMFPASVTAYNVRKDIDNGSVTFVDFTGVFSGEEHDYDPYNRIDWVEQSYNLDLTVFLEGPYNTATNQMETNLNGLLPAAQPFNPALPYYGNPMPDWYYTGAENSPVPNGYVVDWVLVDLRDAASAATATPATSFKQIAAFLLNTGQIVGLDGSSVLSFSHSFLNSLYVAVWHRNHLGVMSANALSRTGDTYSYNFSTGSGQAYGGTSAQKLLGGGKWGMMSGDGNGDGDITIDDINNAWKTEAGTKGYLGGDFNMNTQVENRDKNDGVIENLGSSSQVPD
jgi:hypothetical protein